MKKKTWIITGAVIAVAAVGIFSLSNVASADAAKLVGYTTLTPTELVNSISVKGVVESREKNNVYSTLNFTVKTVDVKVGDVVTAGQVLCQLDTEDLQLNIAQQKASLSVTEQNSLNQLQNSQRIYNEAASNLRNGENTQVLNAESTLKTATTNLENAQKSYNDALEDYQTGNNSQLITAESNLTSAELDLKNKKELYDNNKVLYEAGVVSKDTLTQSEAAHTASQNKYNDALTAVENAKTGRERALEQAETNLNTAKLNYNNALAARDAARNGASQDLEKYKNSVESAQISSNTDSQLIAIQKLEKQLADSTITAPAAGTVTAVYAKEGAAGTGLLFVIEDTDDLEITTKIKEYDIGKVAAGMDTTIKSDATGSNAYMGRISKIDPTAVKNAAGDTVSATDVEFGATVQVISQETGLRIGMNTRMNIILEKKQDVYGVPYDAVATNESGQSVVFAVAEGKDGSYIVQEIPVTIGMETDFYVEISGDGLKDGLRVINDAASVKNGQTVAIQ